MDDDDFDELIANVDFETFEHDYKTLISSEFPFPFKPYDIQVDFMKNLYKTLQESKIGIFESPTGTGKSMSLICGALLWLQHHEEEQQKQLQALLHAQKKIENDLKSVEKADDWINAFVKKQEIEEKSLTLKEKIEAMEKNKEKLEKLNKNGKSNKKRKQDILEDKFEELFHKDALKESNNSNGNNKDIYEKDNNDDELLINDYVSDDDEEEEDGDGNDDVEQVEHVTKIYYCSRTHSQLKQFVNEVLNSPYSHTKTTSLASRMNFCINNTVRKLSSLSLMNEACTDMANKKTAKKNSVEEPKIKRSRFTSSLCPFYKQNLISSLTDQILANAMDIEDIVNQGRTSKACPYYASRRAIPLAQLVVLPYNTVLHKSTRESSGIKLRGNVLVIDEGHNLLETISSIHSVVVTGRQFLTTNTTLSSYIRRYNSRFSAKNLMYMKQVTFIINSCIKLLCLSNGKENVKKEHPKNKEPESEMLTINDFLFKSKTDNLNFFKIKKYCQQSQLSRKLHGFSLRLNANNDKDQTKTTTIQKHKNYISSSSSSSSSMHLIESFIEALSTSDKDGRIIINRTENMDESIIKFLLLNPAIQFKQVLEECRSVVIAGGTMQPVDDFKRQLFSSTGISESRIHEFSCGHVISRDQLLPISLASSASGDLFDFTYQSRDSNNTLKNLCSSILSVTTIVPDGVVCFLASYDYKLKVMNFMKESSFYRRIEENKKIFDEPRHAQNVENVLEDYSKCIQTSGAILFCVVGGKMSEGINFSDELGRCVIVVGLPYPNIKSPELNEKIIYLNSTMGKSSDGRMAGTVHVENLCIKAVNQSIGRAIRHRNDFASIVLLDHRYTKPHTYNKLPGWIKKHLICPPSFHSGMKQLSEFFSHKIDKRPKAE